MVEGKNEEMSTSELSGGARIHYIFQSIFVKSLEVYNSSVFPYGTVRNVFSHATIQLKMENAEEAIVNSLACQPYWISWMEALLSYLLLLFIYTTHMILIKHC